MQGKYTVVDTTLSITDSTPIPGLNGRQGDSGRIIYFALKDGRLPHNLDGQDVALQVKDAAGKVKVVNGIYDMISATAGLFSMLIPAEVYQAAGDVEEAFLVVTDNQNLVISSVSITFTVFANGIILSANASQDYINTIQKMIDELENRMKPLNANLSHAENAYKLLNDSLDQYTQLVNENAVAKLNTINEFKENLTADKDIIAKGNFIGDLKGIADNAVTSNEATMAKTGAIPYFNNVDIDLNTLPDDKTKFRYYSSFYFSSPTSVKNTPNGLERGIVETFVLTSSSIIQRFTDTTAAHTKNWTRSISHWTDAPIYGNWVSNHDMITETVQVMGGAMSLVRVGDTVTVTLLANDTPSQKFNAYSNILPSGTIPPGYRPVNNYAGLTIHTDAAATNSNRRDGLLQIGANGWLGSVDAYIKDDLKNDSIVIAGTYVTKDDMPE